MDYGAQHQQIVAQQGQQPATPPVPPTPPAGDQATPPANNDDVLTLDDLFPVDDKGTNTVTPPAQQQVTPPAQQSGGEGEPDDAAKQKAELEARLKESEQRLSQTVNSSVEQMTQKIDRNNELSTFFQNDDNKPFRKYQTEIAKVARDSRFIGLPLDRAVALALGPKAMMKIGAELGQAALTTAKGNSTGGNSNTQRVINGSQPNYATMTNEEFAARRDAVIRGEKPN